jgi:hypothetical protein
LKNRNKTKDKKHIALNRTVDDNKERDRISDISEIGKINDKEQK